MLSHKFVTQVLFLLMTFHEQSLISVPTSKYSCYIIQLNFINFINECNKQ